MKLPWEEIEELTKYLEQKGLSEISIETKDGKITVKRDLEGKIKPVLISTSDSETKSTQVEKKDSSKSKFFQVISPMVGTFYMAPSPGAEPFIKVGSKVKSGDVLCIIEAMKIMNELPSEVNGTVVEILVKDNQTVEYGQVLIRIDPS